MKICFFDSIILLNFSLSSTEVEGAASGGATAGQPAEEKKGDERLWRSVVIGEQEHRIDMKCIEPYKRVISHGGTQTQTPLTRAAFSSSPPLQLPPGDSLLSLLCFFRLLC